jgi:hypothetical protein
LFPQIWTNLNLNIVVEEEKEERLPNATDSPIRKVVRRLDYKSVIEEQIRELQKAQDKEACYTAKVELAKTIAELCEKAKCL